MPETAEFATQDLASYEVFAGLDDYLLEELASHIKSVCYPKNAEILSHGHPSRDVYLIGSGAVRVNTVSSSGRQITFRILRAGEIFGEMAALDGSPRSASVLAEEACVLGQIEYGAFNDLVERHAPLAVTIMRRLVVLVRALSDKLFEYHTFDVRGRILLELLRLDEEASTVGSALIVLTGKDMASRVGTTRENVTRILNILFAEGVAIREGRGVRLLDRDALRSMLADCEFH